MHVAADDLNQKFSATGFAAVAPASDPIAVQQVLLNLIVNAVEAMGNSPKRTLQVTSTRKRPNNIRISVADSGPGFDPDSFS